MFSKKFGAIVAALALAAMTASCMATPESKILAACKKDPGSTAESCECFVDGLKETLTDDEMTAFAESLEESAMNDPEAQTRMQERLGLNGMMKVAGAAKNCAMSGQ